MPRQCCRIESSAIQNRCQTLLHIPKQKANIKPHAFYSACFPTHNAHRNSHAKHMVCQNPHNPTNSPQSVSQSATCPNDPHYGMHHVPMTGTCVHIVRPIKSHNDYGLIYHQNINLSTGHIPQVGEHGGARVTLSCMILIA
jgi:hypothetical protein